MYGVGVVKGLLLTFRHLFRRPFTVQYPEERLPLPRRVRGLEFTWSEIRCTGCASCAKMCPQGNIEIVTSYPVEGPAGLVKYKVEKFDIDGARCMYYGLCVEASPFDAPWFGGALPRAHP